MSDLTELDDATLAGELEARRQRAAAEQAERQRQTEADELARYQRIADTFVGIEEAKKAETEQYRAAFTAAVAAADFQAAFAAWVGERSTRYFRTALRDQYRTALAKTGNAGAVAVADLRYYDPDLLKRLEEEGDRQACNIGYGAADDAFGVRPPCSPLAGRPLDGSAAGRRGGSISTITPPERHTHDPVPKP